MRYYLTGILFLLSLSTADCYAVSLTVDGTTAVADPHHVVSKDVAGQPGMKIVITPVKAGIPTIADSYPGETSFMNLFMFNYTPGSAHYGFYDAIGSDGLTIIDKHVMFTNLWYGVCFQANCSVAGGYLADNPMQGVIVFVQPHFAFNLVVVLAPEANGPMRVTNVDAASGLVTVESLKGHFYSSAHAIVPTPGGSKYTYNLRDETLK